MNVPRKGWTLLMTSHINSSICIISDLVYHSDYTRIKDQKDYKYVVLWHKKIYLWQHTERVHMNEIQIKLSSSLENKPVQDQARKQNIFVGCLSRQNRF